MPASDSTSSGGARPLKSTTRTSMRHSLTLASVGKALADVMNKEGREADRNAKKEQRRLSAIGTKSFIAAPRSSMGDSKPPVFFAKRENTPDSKTITRKRASAGQKAGAVDQSPKAPRGATPTDPGVARSALLRPRSQALSALPKYRPRSVIVEPTEKAPSPTRVSARRRISSSGDEREDSQDQDDKTKGSMLFSPIERLARPISPLPQRGAFKVNLTNAMNITASSPSAKAKTSSNSTQTTPSRPSKLVKATTPNASVNKSAIPRPPSSSSSSGSFTPRTPKTPSLKNPSLRQSGGNGGSPSPLSAASRADPESPLARHSRKDCKSNTPVTRNDSLFVGDMSHISEGDSEDSSEADDVEMLLAPVASLAAPTPAMPRIHVTRNRLDPQTPTRSSKFLLPSRANMSYTSPLPPDAGSSPSLRPPSSNEKAPRGSILSWEQLATDASRTLGEEEIDSMLADIPPPFSSDATSPGPQTRELVPESPCLSALPSPGGYGSISQVLLPDVTPSPAIHHHTQRYDDSSELPIVDAAIVTLLRLQLASVESTAKERLFQLQVMEEELHTVKEACRHDTKEISQQVVYLEEQLRGTLEVRDKVAEERATYITSLEDQLRDAQALRDRAIKDAVEQALYRANLLQAATMKFEQQKWDAACSARAVTAAWGSVLDIAEGELDLVREGKEMLAVLLGELDQAQRQVMFGRTAV